MLLLQLSLCVVTVIQLTSSQPTYDVTNDVSICERTDQVLSQLTAMQTEISKLRSDGGEPKNNYRRTSVQACPSGFTHISNVNGCYKLVRDNLAWDIAGLRCKALHEDAHLLVIDNAAEQQAISSWMSTYGEAAIAECARFTPTHPCQTMFWIAGQRYNLAFRPSPFVWKKYGSRCDGDGVSEMLFTYWGSYEPNDHSSLDWQLRPVSSPLPEKCLQLCRGDSYKWNDALCEIPACSICEVDIN